MRHDSDAMASEELALLKQSFILYWRSLIMQHRPFHGSHLHAPRRTETLDTEALRQLSSRYSTFHCCSVSWHGGSCDQFLSVEPCDHFMLSFKLKIQVFSHKTEIIYPFLQNLVYVIVVGYIQN